MARSDQDGSRTISGQRVGDTTWVGRVGVGGGNEQTAPAGEQRVDNPALGAVSGNCRRTPQVERVVRDEQLVTTGEIPQAVVLRPAA